MWKIVRCSVCGKKGRIKINDETGKIESHWAYFGKVHLGDKEVDYFECPKCSRVYFRRLHRTRTKGHLDK